MKKKLLGMLFVLGLLLALPSMMSFAVSYAGNCGATGSEGDVKCKLDDSGSFTISGRGSGVMKNYNSTSEVEWLQDKYRPYITTLEIEHGVTNIGDYTFYSCENLTSVTIPRSIKRIGEDAFSDCNKLTNVYYAGTQEDWNSIAGKESLTSANISYCICGAKGNEANVTWSLENSTLTISGSGYMRDYTVENKAPWNDSIATIKAVVIGKGLKNIGGYAFSGCENLTSVTIPRGVAQIGNNAFNDCTSLTDVYYTDEQLRWDIISKGDGNGCLVNATLYCKFVKGGTCGDQGNEANVKWVLDGDGTLTISGSGAMADYTVENKAPWNDSIANIKIVVIKEDVNKIGDYAFSGCENLTLITIPKSVVNIGNNAFNDCTSLNVVYYTGTKGQWGNVNGKGSLNSAHLYYNFVKGGTCGDQGNEANVKWVLDGYDTLTIIGTGEMKDYSLMKRAPWNDYIATIKTVVIENGVTVIGVQAFYDCANLKSVTIPNSVTRIVINAFMNCTKLTDVYYAGTQGDWDAVTKYGGNDCLTSANISYCICGAKGNEANVKWSLENSTLAISGSGAMKDYTYETAPWHTCSSEEIKAVVIGKGVTNIGDYAFDGCVNLTLIYVPEGCSVGTSAIPDVASQINYRVEHTTKNKDKNIDDEKIVVITSVTKSITLNCDSMGNGYYIIKSEAGESVTLSDVCKPDGTKHTGYSMRRREEITDKDHVYGCVIEKDGVYSRRCIDCGDVQACEKIGEPVTLGNLTYKCYTCGGNIKVVELDFTTKE